MTKGFPPYHGTSSAGSRMVFTSKCTPDCRRFGHSDTYWVSDSQRAPSRMSSFKAAAAGEDPAPGGSLYHVNNVGEVGSYLDPRRGTTPEPGEHKMRCTSAPSCNTPYYYDPVSNFESTPPSQNRRPNNYPQTRNNYPHFTSFHRDPNYATGTFPYPGGGGACKQAYVNMQTDGGGSALSYSGGGEPPYQNYEPHHILPHPHHQQQHPVQQYPIMTSYQQPYHTYEDVAYDQAYRAAPYSMGSAAPYDDEFPPAPNMNGDDPGSYKQRSTPTTYYQQQQQQQNYSENKDQAASVDKLSTIREEIDADEVIAGIDGLLL